MRIGHGYDVHAFGEGDHVILGGVRIEHDHGLVAHSDGDVLLHALTDALFGAMALGDIGGHFPGNESPGNESPGNDNKYAGADSRELLRLAYAQVQSKGYALVNADVTVIAQAPAVAPHVEAMRAHIAADLQARPGQVSIKATTTDGLGFAGRREGIAAHAVVLLAPAD